MKKGYEIALNDDDMRKLNTKKVVDCVENISEYVKEGRKQAKTTKYYLIIMLGIFLFLFLGGLVAVAVKSGGISKFIDNMWVTDNINKRIKCFSDDSNMTFRNSQEAFYFKEIFTDSYCIIENKT